MGLIQSNAGPPDFSRAVISIWFNVPQASMTAAKSQYDAAVAVFPNTDFSLPGVIPLLTFGPTTEAVTSYNDVEGVISVSPVSPCVIGISCGIEVGEDVVVRNVMYARLQYSSNGTTVNPDIGGQQQHDFFQVGAPVGPYAGSSNQYIVIAPGVWHHALISFDVSGGSAASFNGSSVVIDRSSQFYWAIDDVNYTDFGIGTPNAIISMATGNQPIYDGSSYSFSVAIPSSGYSIGIPTHDTFVARNRNVRMSRFQMFTGVTMDTAPWSNRRAFVTEARKPADPTLAAQLLGKQPLYRFDSSKDWIDGNNLGTGGVFTPSGTISSFTPSP